MIILETLGGTYSDAMKINNFGQIVGWSQTTSVQYHSVIWQFQLEEPSEAVNTVVDEVEALIESEAVNTGEGQALTSMLENAIRLMERGNTNAAINQLQSFIHLVTGLLNKGDLSETEGQSLIVQATNLINQLNG
jgi:uncharacterized membrane protein